MITLAQAKAEVPATWEELYPAVERRVIHKSEKLFFRTRNRIEFTIMEDRQFACVIILNNEVSGLEPQARQHSERKLHMLGLTTLMGALRTGGQSSWTPKLYIP